MRKVPHPKPGEILFEELLQPMVISACRLAKDIGVPQMRISEILAGKRAITVDIGLRLSRYFGLHDGFWTGLQLDHDAAVAKDELAHVLASIKPLHPAWCHAGCGVIGERPLESASGKKSRRHGAKCALEAC